MFKIAIDVLKLKRYVAKYKKEQKQIEYLNAEIAKHTEISNNLREAIRQAIDDCQ